MLQGFTHQMVIWHAKWKGEPLVTLLVDLAMAREPNCERVWGLQWMLLLWVKMVSLASWADWLRQYCTAKCLVFFAACRHLKRQNWFCASHFLLFSDSQAEELGRIWGRWAKATTFLNDCFKTQISLFVVYSRWKSVFQVWIDAPRWLLLCVLKLWSVNKTALLFLQGFFK